MTESNVSNSFFSAKAKGGLFSLPLLCLKLPFSPAFPTLDAKERACLVSIYAIQGQNKLMLKLRNAFIFTGVEHKLCLCLAAFSLSLEVV